MSNGTAEVPSQPIVLTAEDIETIKQTVAKDCKSPANLAMYLHDCQRQGVHPLDRLIHYTERKGRYTPITSIDLFRSRAAEPGDHAGTDDPVFDGEPRTPDFTATVTVYRIVKGQRCAWTVTARWAEYYPGDGVEGFMWRKMPYLMLGKCAEALCLRKAFPRQLHGMYVREEMDQADAPTIAAPPPAPALPAPPPPPAPSPRVDFGECISPQLVAILDKSLSSPWCHLDDFLRVHEISDLSLFPVAAYTAASRAISDCELIRKAAEEKGYERASILDRYQSAPSLLDLTDQQRNEILAKLRAAIPNPNARRQSA